MAFAGYKVVEFLDAGKRIIRHPEFVALINERSSLRRQLKGRSGPAKACLALITL